MKKLYLFSILALAAFLVSCSKNNETACPKATAPTSVKAITRDKAVEITAEGNGNRMIVIISPGNKVVTSAEKTIKIENLKNNTLYTFTIGLGYNCDTTHGWADPIQAIPSPLDKEAMLAQVNAFRAKGYLCSGRNQMPPVAPVRWNIQLELAAIAHSKDMASKGFFSHTGSDGTNPPARIARFGYVYIVCGENIARGYPAHKVIPDGWMKSQTGHCENIMNANFEDMAIAVEFSAQNEPYYTQVFAKKKEKK